MPYQFSFDEELKIVRCKIQGLIDKDVIYALIRDIGDLIIQKNIYSILVDFRGATTPFSLIEIFQTPKMIDDYYAEKGIQVRKLKRAYVISMRFDRFQFFETVSMNSSQTVKYFLDEEEAIHWLTSE